MILRVPYYYKEFQCIAGACKDSCCIGWEIDIDEDTFAYYQELEGEFGDRLRASMAAGEDNTFVLKKGRCPFLNEANLCDICLELGEEALCQVCTEYPRFVIEYGDVTEKSLALSCEVVGQLVFGRREPIYVEEILQDDYFADEEEAGQERANEEEGEEGEEDQEDFSFAPFIEKARDLAISLIQDRSLPIEERICRMLFFARDFQEQINAEDESGMEAVLHRWNQADAAPEGDCYDGLAGERSVEGNRMETFRLFAQRMNFFKKMEVLDKEWEEASAQVEETIKQAGQEGYFTLRRQFMDSLGRQDREYEYEHLCVYFLFRYIMQAVYDSNFFGHGAAAAACFLMIRDMDMVRFHRQGGVFSLEDRIDVARIFSKEVEHSEENLEYLLDGVYYEEFMTLENLIRQVV